jgi:hypothetical protein
MDFSFFTDKKAPWDGHEGYFGTPGYMSPEHMTRKIPQPASDVFTLGLMLYQLLAQGHPYIFEDAEKYLPAYRAHSAARPRLQGIPRLPATAATIENVLYQCLHPDPERRPSAAELHRALTGESTGIGLGAIPRKSTPETPLAPVAPLSVEVEPPPKAMAEKKEISGRIVLRSAEGVEQSVGARVVFGRVVLAKFGDGARYASDQQFILDRDEDEWYIVACPRTINDTMLNGALLEGDSRVKIAVGDTIAIGKAATKKTVLELRVQNG